MSSADGEPTDVENQESSNVPEHKDKGALKPISETTPKERVAGIVACTAVGTSALAMVMSQGPLVLGAGILSCGIGPYAYYQQTKLTDIAALKETHEAIEREVNRLAAENERLGSSVEELGETVNKLEDCENALDVITQTQGQSVDAFAEQVAENREILAQMQKNLKANVLQNLLSVIIRSDADNSMTIDETEVEGLVARIKSINGVALNESLFRNAITKNGGSLQAVMDVVKNLLSDSGAGESEMFMMDEDE
uniref:Uncharacterized protein n=1 Tax=Eucampia antarctica TaxID=49252 RepID=A0A7S2WN88_9STRA|mmetsp:Transcript_7625/g.7177  ORF Transcript_7625/g.7177 Transcript_7625/m.7177 type:complete len:253 (+) Transcript_7625:81-839(+)|eukprot:CAMPEP_0197833116 /NCGR_PEP_ID=MMETSP1437-20131217/17818_1 /TAXON_ID=49252 ORGANISM="Eucampia antarctica, Strain CCMP1452" /NCGR_SAMPLE_ID=MMETSP1437 /ASSEMBLY_ACC=CAM_ASM_001096 /LENGTH=252 /DNA_ID=CAMNT_0043436959 /DNA_START=81 /DNA_END=839 /DNA_ORIENTATION=-